MKQSNIIPDGPVGNLIEDEKLINYITKNINYGYNVKGQNIFPGPQPASIEKKDFVKLINYNYNVGLKLDGTRFIMYLYKNKNVNTCVLINRALEIYTMDVFFDNTDLYNGSIIDGELCNNNNDTWDFVAHDSPFMCGLKINKLNHNERLDVINSSVINNENNIININVKTFYNFKEFNSFIENEYNNVKYNNDGLIFMPVNLPVASGTQYSMLKWKPPTNHTFDFLIKEIEHNSFEACVYHLKNITTFANIHYSDDNGKIFIDKTKAFEHYKNECILECTFENNNFVPLLIRTDKTHPNSLRTIERTLFNINENIIIDDLKQIK